MQKLKRIFALTGAVLLAALYVCTLVFALMKSEWADLMLKASIGATILIPVLLYGMILIARVLKKDGGQSDGSSDVE